METGYGKREGNGGRETLLSQNLEPIKNVCSLLLEETEQLETAKDDASVRELTYA